MMNLRKSCLPPGWYPQNSQKIKEFLGNTFPVNSGEAESRDSPHKNKEFRTIGAVAPHAGWYYSGHLAARSVRALAACPKKPETIVVLGGHLPPPIALFALEDAVSTPIGVLEIDVNFRDELIKNLKHEGIKTAEDRYADNTVEVLLPMVHFYFPEIKIVWIRLPGDIRSYDTGKIIAETASLLNKNIVVLGSTDLTHYGPNYGFTNKGYGEEALFWVKNTNDKRFIEAVEKGDPALVLKRAEEENSSCSAGAVLGVMGYAAELRDGNGAGKLLACGTRADSATALGEPVPNSFVGYGSFVWEE